jgi:hypothetical protein
MRALDTNVLVYAEIVSSRHHARARQILGELAGAPEPWAIPWPCVYEFLRVVTHARVYHPPVPLDLALSELARILSSPSLVLLKEGPRHFDVLRTLLASSPATGNLVHDAHIAALCLDHGVSELITGDADFARFEKLRIRNPFRG